MLRHRAYPTQIKILTVENVIEDWSIDESQAKMLRNGLVQHFSYHTRSTLFSTMQKPLVFD